MSRASGPISRIALNCRIHGLAIIETLINSGMAAAVGTYLDQRLHATVRSRFR